MTTQHPQTEDAREAENMGEKPDLGRTPDAMLSDALSGTDSGSDTRSGSLQGGASTGSSDDPDQDAINASLASEGMAAAAPHPPASVDPTAVNNTGEDRAAAGGNRAEGKRGEADAATG